MKLHISSQDVEITKDVEDVIEKKLLTKVSRLVKRYPEEAVQMRIMITKGERWGFQVKCDIDLPGDNIHAEEKHKELEYAVVALAKELQSLLRKKKEKALP